MSLSEENAEIVLGLCDRITLFMEFFGAIYYSGFHIVTIMASAQRLYQFGYDVLGTMTLFFLLFPGIFMSLVLTFFPSKQGHRRYQHLTYPFLLKFVFICYSSVPIWLCFFAMRTGLRRDLAKLALLFGGFLNGPQLILGMGKIQAFGVGNELADYFFAKTMGVYMGVLFWFRLQFDREKLTDVVKSWIKKDFPVFPMNFSSRILQSYICIEFKLDEDLTPEESRSKIIDPVTLAFVREIFEIFFYLQMDTITEMYSKKAKEDPLPNMDEPDMNRNVLKLTNNMRHGRRNRPMLTN